MAEQLATFNPDANKDGYKPTKHEVYDFLQSQKLGHIATLDDTGQPQVAIVAFRKHQSSTLLLAPVRFRVKL